MHPFEIVAEPVRRRIIETLAVGEHQVGVLNDVITAEFAVTRSAVSHHLRIMRDEHVVDVRSDGAQGRLYALNAEYLDSLDHAVGELFHLWDHRYGSLYRRAPLHPAPTSRRPHRLGRKGTRGRRPTLPDAADHTDPATPTHPAREATSADPADP
ncbi:ArsR/SmtB family transcription factor [Agromyces silvae]|uniref:ArsR/SmtB family transcription factor n=1 Tax=Agromyces silvae TaxID=3388266 RepID=UPI00280C04C7|nr:ArsR family transcriptional regulator [Agromyces protaetiae]